MNTIHIIVKEFKQNIRNWKANAMMILFPIILIIILGAAFTGVFNNDINLDNVKVLYTLNNSEQLSTNFVNFSKELSTGLGIKFEETSDINYGLKSIKDTEYSCYIIVDKDPDEIKLYKNERFNFEANLVQSMMKTFTDRYSAIAEIYKTNPGVIGKIMSDNTMDFVKKEGLDKKNQPSSTDYYAVTMLTLIIMYSSLTGMWGIKGEHTLKTGNRVLCSPVRRQEFLVGKVLGSILVTVVQVSVVILFSKVILKANWGSDIPTIMLMVVAESIMAISIGTGVAYLFKNDGAATGLLNTIIPIMVLLGGGYVPLDQMGAGLVKMSVLSPVKWVNTAIIRVIYDNDYSLVAIALIVNLAVAAAFITVSAVLSRKEAV